MTKPKRVTQKFQSNSLIEIFETYISNSDTQFNFYFYMIYKNKY